MAKCRAARASTQANAQASSRPKGILKRRPTKSIFQKLVRRASRAVGSMATRLALCWPPEAKPSAERRVMFEPAVKVTEFSRRLDGGDTIPLDGSIVTLGLGRPVLTTTVPLAAEPPVGRPSLDDRAFVDPRERLKILRKAMGDARFFGKWQQHRRQTRQIIADRKDTRAKDVGFKYPYMPTSLLDAQERGRQMSEEAKLEPPHHEEKLGAADDLVCHLKSSLKPKRVNSGTPRKSKRGASGMPTGTGSALCHRCFLPISSQRKNARCLCLVASPLKKSRACGDA